MLSTKAFCINLSSVTLFPWSHTAPSDSLFPFLLLKPALLVSSFSEINDNEELTCYFIYFYFWGKNKHTCPSSHGFFFICSLLHLYTLLWSPGSRVSICIEYFHLLIKKKLRSLFAVILHCTFISITKNLCSRNID